MPLRSFTIARPFGCPWRSAAGIPGRLVHDRQGAAAVEFGLVCLPFLALLGGIIQIAFMTWASQNLDFMLQRTSRTLFTGTFQMSTVGITDTATLLAQLKSKMCSGGTATVFDCAGVKLDVTLGTSFATSTTVSPVDPSTKEWASGFGSHYTCAPPGKIVIVTAAVKFPVFFSILNPGLANFTDGSKLLQSTAVFRTEPYSADGAATC